ncbi:MAG: tetratricopeptide repeat protein [Proteobacteria bacterium]|nr:tetratricopeptide repeat protein [Pseudomonadota bacterium]
MTGDIIRAHLRNGELLLARVAATACLETASDDPELGEIYALLSRAWFRLGQPRKAMDAAEQAAQLTDHWEASLSLAEAMVGLGDPLPARSLLSTALSTVRQEGSEARPEAGQVDAEIQVGAALAEACRAAGDPDTGIDVASRALSWAERYMGYKTPETADALHALGVCLHGSGRDEEAFKVLERALKIRRVHAPGTTSVAGTLDALAVVQRNLRKPFKAVKLHQEALKIWTQTVGEHASPLGACRHSYAQALHRTGDFLGAKTEMEIALTITARNLGQDHVDTWITRFELGRFEMDVGEMEEGLRHMEEARKIVAERLGTHHPVVKAMDRWL